MREIVTFHSSIFSFLMVHAHPNRSARASKSVLIMLLLHIRVTLLLIDVILSTHHNNLPRTKPKCLTIFCRLLIVLFFFGTNTSSPTVYNIKRCRTGTSISDLSKKFIYHIDITICDARMTLCCSLFLKFRQKSLL